MLKDKVIIVTGGAGLIGQEFVKSIIQNEGIAIIADINEDIGYKIKNDLSIELKSKNIEFLRLDITSKESINKMISFLDEKYGRIDGLVNNAYPRNKNYGKHFFEVKYEDFCENISSHLGGYFLTSQKFAEYFKKQQEGNIINIASIYGVIAPRFEIYQGTQMTVPVEYVVIKSAIIHLTKYMAQYLKGTGIRVNCLSPGGIFDNQPLSFLQAYNNKCTFKGMLNKSDLGGSLVYLLSDLSKYVNGQNLIVDDGFTL